MRVGILQNDQGCQCATTLGECRGGYDLWRRMCICGNGGRVVNKHHQQSCCGQKRVCTYVVGGRVGMNDTCYFTLDMKKLDLCSLLIYTPSSHRHRPRRNTKKRRSQETWIINPQPETHYLRKVETQVGLLITSDCFGIKINIACWMIL